jgi:tetratricopeptide (TPR) repeat protein
VSSERPKTGERGVVDARKARALRDLVEVERQRQAGEIDAETAEHLTKIYEAEIVAALEPEPVAAEQDVLSVGRVDRTTRTLTLVGIVVVACVAIVAVVVGHSDRGASGSVQSTVSTLAGGGRDLSTVTDDEMEAVIKQNPSITPMRLALIERYLKEGNLEKAKEHAQLALDNNPSDADREKALKYLGWTTAALGDPHGGADLLDQSLKIDPTDLDAKWFLANVKLTQLDDAAGAATLLRDILAQPISDAQRSSVEAKLKEAEQGH